MRIWFATLRQCKALENPKGNLTSAKCSTYLREYMESLNNYKYFRYPNFHKIKLTSPCQKNFC